MRRHARSSLGRSVASRNTSFLLFGPGSGSRTCCLNLQTLQLWQLAEHLSLVLLWLLDVEVLQGILSRESGSQERDSSHGKSLPEHGLRSPHPTIDPKLAYAVQGTGLVFRISGATTD